MCLTLTCNYAIFIGCAVYSVIYLSPHGNHWINIMPAWRLHDATVYTPNLSPHTSSRNTSFHCIMLNRWLTEILSRPHFLGHFLKWPPSKHSCWIQWPCKCGFRHQICVSKLTKCQDMSNSIFGRFRWRPFWKVPKKVYNAYLSVGALNKMIPLMEDHGRGGGGGARWPLWAHGLCYIIKMFVMQNEFSQNYKRHTKTEMRSVCNQVNVATTCLIHHVRINTI